MPSARRAPSAVTAGGCPWRRRSRCRSPGRWRRSASRRPRPRAGPCGRAGRPRAPGRRRSAGRGSGRSAALRILPSANRIASNSAPPRPMTTAPSTWFVRWSGLTIAPHSKAVTARTTLTAPVGPVDGDLGAGGDVAPLLGPAGDAEAAARGGLRLAPAEPLGGGLEDGPQPRVLRGSCRRNASGSIPTRVGQLVHERLAGEVVGRRRQGAVRALAQRRARRVELRPCGSRTA